VTSHFLSDALGSSVALADASGAVQTEYTYEPFGTTTTTGASNSNPYQYTGREIDGSGLYYYRNRYYQPQLQRFITEDPIEFLGGSPDLYAYVANNPMRLVDPSGLLTVSIGIKVSLGLGIGGGGGLAINFGFGRKDKFSFSITGTAEGGGIAGIAQSLQGVFQITNLDSVRELNGPFLSVAKSLGVGVVGGGDIITTTSGQLVGFDIFGGTGLRAGLPDAPVGTTVFVSTTSTIFGFSSQTGFFGLSDR
jgi:RHS repeat-associated protein